MTEPPATLCGRRSTLGDGEEIRNHLPRDGRRKHQFIHQPQRRHVQAQCRREVQRGQEMTDGAFGGFGLGRRIGRPILVTARAAIRAGAGATAQLDRPARVQRNHHAEPDGDQREQENSKRAASHGGNDNR